MSSLSDKCVRLIGLARGLALRLSPGELRCLEADSRNDTDAIIDFARTCPIKDGQYTLILAGQNRAAQILLHAVYARNFICWPIYYRTHPLQRRAYLVNYRNLRFPMEISYTMIQVHRWAKRNRMASRRFLKAHFQHLRQAAEELRVRPNRYYQFEERMEYRPMDREPRRWHECACFLELMEGDESHDALMELWHACQAHELELRSRTMPRGEVARKLHGSLELSRLVSTAFYLRQWPRALEIARELEERFQLASARSREVLRQLKCPIHLARAIEKYIEAQSCSGGSDALHEECLVHLEAYLKALSRSEWPEASGVAICIQIPTAILLKGNHASEVSFAWLSLFPGVLAFDPEAAEKARLIPDCDQRIAVDWDRVLKELNRLPFAPGREPSMIDESWLRKVYADFGVPYPEDGPR